MHYMLSSLSILSDDDKIFLPDQILHLPYTPKEDSTSKRKKGKKLRKKLAKDTTENAVRNPRNNTEVLSQQYKCIHKPEKTVIKEVWDTTSVGGKPSRLAE